MRPLLPAPFPIRLRDHISKAKQILGPPEVDIQDAAPGEWGIDKPRPPRDWWRVKFTSMRRVRLPFIRAASADIFMGYRPSTGAVWFIEVADASRKLNASIEGLASEARLAAAVAEFGPPVAEHPDPFATLIHAYWWRRGDTVFHLRAFREDYEDVTGSWRAGDAKSIRVLALELAPVWEEAFTVMPARGGA